MEDRISQILKQHIANAQNQLELIRVGVKFDGVTEPIPDTVEELMALIAKWEGDLARHEARHA